MQSICSSKDMMESLTIQQTEFAANIDGASVIAALVWKQASILFFCNYKENK